MAARALISIDYTHDFVADQGLLTVGEPAQAIEEAITQLTRKAYQRGDFIIFAIDAHDKNDTYHPESRLFPPHNIKGTKGRLLYGELGKLYESIKDDNKVFWLDKRYYSAFSGTDLDSRLRERQVDTLLLSGVLTDVCVLHTAIDAYNLGYHIEIAKSAVATVSDEKSRFALHHFEHFLGAQILEDL